MSLTELRKMTEEGRALFARHIDGSYHMLTPERSIEIQHNASTPLSPWLSTSATPYPATHEQAADSMRLSMRWAKRSKDAFRAREGYGLFGIVQGQRIPRPARGIRGGL